MDYIIKTPVTDYNENFFPGSSNSHKKPVPWLTRAGFTFLFVLAVVVCPAQSNKLPPFRMLQENGKVFNATQLPIGKPIVLVYFEPGCDHCELLTKNMLKDAKTLARASVAMITYTHVKEVAGFVKQFGLKKYVNFYVGTEGNSFFLKNYYHLERLPFMALYTKNGDLVKKYTSEEGWSDLIKQLKNLK